MTPPELRVSMGGGDHHSLLAHMLTLAEEVPLQENFASGHGTLKSSVITAINSLGYGLGSPSAHGRPLEGRAPAALPLSRSISAAISFNLIEISTTASDGTGSGAAGVTECCSAMMVFVRVCSGQCLRLFYILTEFKYTGCRPAFRSNIGTDRNFEENEKPIYVRPAAYAEPYRCLYNLTAESGLATRLRTISTVANRRRFGFIIGRVTRSAGRRALRGLCGSSRAGIVYRVAAALNACLLPRRTPREIQGRRAV
ncbi:hypothetical protein EVAR_26440_1 [Eumeta japonica]|uniref:Uncharacterized protein n=1 Tax=Eumeta variegata TaxID=151549 RepID=A0A4C1VSJ5_EUMVA|nr:hypothetical protein EVAR_26440_1 [Eumeta japonica]